MSEKITIPVDIYRNKNADELTKALSDPKGKLEAGSASAYTAACAAALLLRAASIAQEERPEDERLGYIVRNAEIVRGYMVHLIDEDVKCRGPLLRAFREGGEREIEASRQPAISICSEIINMMSQTLDMAKDACGLCPKDAMQYLGECTHLALGAIKSARIYILDMSDRCSDDTYRYIVRRENEITLSQCEETAAEILKTVEASI